jgi:hypothetical protein
LHPKLKWSTKLYPKNNDYIELTVNTANFRPNTCINAISVDVAFLDEKGQEVQSKTFRFYATLRQGEAYVDWHPHSLSSVHAAKGQRISYEFFNCGLQQACKGANFFQRLFGIKPKCEKETKMMLLEEGEEEVGLSPDARILQIQEPPTPKAP